MFLLQESNLWVFILDQFLSRLNKFNFVRLVSPKLSAQLSAKNQSEGKYFQIFCTVEDGSDPLFFLWSINGSNVKPSPDVNYKIANDKRFSILSIEKLSQKDSANYGCVVSNQFGSDSQNIILTVTGMLLFSLFILVTPFC